MKHNKASLIQSYLHAFIIAFGITPFQSDIEATTALWLLPQALQAYLGPAEWDNLDYDLLANYLKKLHENWGKYFLQASINPDESFKCAIKENFSQLSTNQLRDYYLVCFVTAILAAQEAFEPILYQPATNDNLTHCQYRLQQTIEYIQKQLHFNLSEMRIKPAPKSADTADDEPEHIDNPYATRFKVIRSMR